MVKFQRRENKAKKLQLFLLYCEDCGVPLGRQATNVTGFQVPFCPSCWYARSASSAQLVRVVR